MVNDLGDYVDLIRGDIKTIDRILLDMGFEDSDTDLDKIDFDIEQKDLDRIFTLLEDIESYAEKAKKLV